MIVLKMLADAFHEGGWGMWPILFLLMITISIVIERAVFLRRAVIDKEKLVALLRSQISAGQHPGRDQGLLGQLDAAHPDRAVGPDARQSLGRGDQLGHGRGRSPRAAAAREADRLPGDARQPGDPRRPARDHHRSHQGVRRRRRRRPLAEGDPALEGDLGGDELHRLRPHHRHRRPGRRSPG